MNGTAMRRETTNRKLLGWTFSLLKGTIGFKIELDCDVKLVRMSFLNQVEKSFHIRSQDFRRRMGADESFISCSKGGGSSFTSVGLPSPPPSSLTRPRSPFSILGYSLSPTPFIVFAFVMAQSGAYDIMHFLAIRKYCHC